MQIGSGTFGNVVAKGNKAVKTFRTKEPAFEHMLLNHMIQECLVTIFLNDSPYTINLLGYDFEKLQMTTQLWKTSLRSAIRRYEFSHDEKLKIFKQLLRGMCHLQSRHITHSDFKPSNILINVDEVDVCLADFGLTSIHKYAKVRQTAEGYRSEIKAPAGMHDMFGLAMSMADLFGNIRLGEHRLTPRELRRRIDHNISDKTIAKALRRLCPDHPADAATPAEILLDVFGETAALPAEPVRSFKTSLSPEVHEYLQTTIERVTHAAGIERGYRCYQCLTHYLDNPDNEPVEAYSYPLYIGVMVMIFSSVFGTPGFSIEEIHHLTGRRYRTAEIYRILYNLFKDENMIRLAMLPGSDI